jgi:hypothetical protein
MAKEHGKKIERKAVGVRVQFSPEARVSFTALKQLIDGEILELEIPGKLVFEAIDEDGVPVSWELQPPPEGCPF